MKHSIEGTILEEKLFVEFDEFMAMTDDENSESDSETEKPPFKKITYNTDYKIKTFLEEPPSDLELKPLLDNLEYVFLEETSFLPVIISSQLSELKESGPPMKITTQGHLLTMKLKPEKFKLHHLGDFKREASINLNANVGDEEKDEVQEIRRLMGRDKAKDAAKKKGSRASGSSSMNDEALARLMGTEMANLEKEECLAFLEIKRKEVKCHKREVRNQEYRQRQEYLRFYL
ncbi:hypothetical protein Tco_1426425 [Tanacetum coccineum]